MYSDILSRNNSTPAQNKKTALKEKQGVKESFPQSNMTTDGVGFSVQNSLKSTEEQMDIHKQSAPPKNLPVQPIQPIQKKKKSTEKSNEVLSNNKIKKTTFIQKIISQKKSTQIKVNQLVQESTEQKLQPVLTSEKHRKQKKEMSPAETILSHKETIKIPLTKKTIPGDPLFAARILKQEQTPVKPFTQKIQTIKKELFMQTNKKVPIIRTYKSDVANALKKGKTSITQIVIAEQKKKKNIVKEKKHTPRKKILTVSVILVLVITGVSILAWVGGYTFRSNISTTVKTSVYVPSLVFTEVKNEVDITGVSKNELKKIIKNEIISTNIKLDSIKQLYFTEDIVLQTSDGIQKYKSLLDTKKFFELLDTSAPGRLTRSLDENFMFGVHMFNGKQPFILLKISYFENAFSGMLEWEPFLAEDILPIFAYTGTTTILYNKAFDDVVVKNRDLRVLKNEDGETVLFYTFLDKNTAVITTNTSTLNELILRINKEKIKN